MADSTLKVKVGLDLTDLVTGLRDAAARIEASQAIVAAHESTPTRDEVLDALEGMVTQHCYHVESDDSYDTNALSANREAVDVLVAAGRAVYVGEPHGRMAAIRLVPGA